MGYLIPLTPQYFELILTILFNLSNNLSILIIISIFHYYNYYFKNILSLIYVYCLK